MSLDNGLYLLVCLKGDRLGATVTLKVDFLVAFGVHTVCSSPVVRSYGQPMLLLPHELFLQTQKPMVADNKVIDQFQIKQPRWFYQLGCNRDIFRARLNCP